MENNLPKLHHSCCKNPDCSICLIDHERLGEWLEDAIGGYIFADILALFRTFMDKRLGRSSETEWGWADPEVFKEEHLKAFVTSYLYLGDNEDD